jgi:hypothetical protein
MSSAIERATAHFASLGTLHIDVPEWGENGTPLRVFYKPLTLAELGELTKNGAPPDDEVLYRRALDAEGKRLFTLEDKTALRNAVSQQVITRIALAMLRLPSPAEIEKN